MKILLIEDNQLLSDNIRTILENENYSVEISLDGEHGYSLALINDYDVVILDLMLPKMNGFSVLEYLRMNNIQTPILILSALSHVDNKVRALDGGCDDYLTKPFASEELLARIRSLIRRKYNTALPVVKIGAVEVQISKKKVFIYKEKVELTPKEYELLEFLALNKDKVVSRIALGEHIWGESLDLLTMSNFIDVHIKNLRKKLEAITGKRLIFTRRGNGFILTEGEETKPGENKD